VSERKPVRARRLLRVESHSLGPRVYVLGIRVHEWHLGAAVLLTLLGLDLTGILTGGLQAYAIGLLGSWLIAKDWRDLTGARRDTGSWRLGFHRPVSELRPARRGDWLPKFAAVVVAASAIASFSSAVAPSIAFHGHLFRNLAIVHVAAVFHAAVIPVSATLVVASAYLWRRRVRAWELAFGLLLLLGVFNLLKGPDIGEALLALAAAGLLWWGRDSFNVRPERIPVRASLAGAGVLLVATIGLCTLAVWASAPGRPSVSLVARTTADLLLWQASPIAFRGEFELLPEAVGVMSILGMVGIAWLVFRPLALPLQLPEDEERLRARAVVAVHGTDTLSYFKLRTDEYYLWSDDGSSFLGYRIENGVLLVSGDPVGTARALPGLIGKAIDHAESHGLRFGVVGASGALAELCRDAGMRALYIGDEAIVDPCSFSLEGRPIRKVRQSVSRLEKAGTSVEVLELRAASGELLAELDAVSAAWLEGAEERGFSMALDKLGGRAQNDSLLVVGRGRTGAVCGFLQLVPAQGGKSMSLALMRRLHEAPNGLMEYLIVRALDHLRRDEVRELSLNFVAFGRYLRSPEGTAERLFARLLRRGDRWFQIERLYRFNAKLFPAWQPRYLVYQTITSLPRTALAALWVEGQAPKPRPRNRDKLGTDRCSAPCELGAPTRSAATTIAS
jgi:lysyl-tRNA synthetase class 2